MADQKKSTYRKWNAGMPVEDGVYLLARKNGSNLPTQGRLVRAVQLGPRTILADLETGADVEVPEDSSGFFHFPLPVIREPKAESTSES